MRAGWQFVYHHSERLVPCLEYSRHSTNALLIINGRKSGQFLFQHIWLRKEETVFPGYSGSREILVGDI